jgi:hypothetical protein
MFKPPSAVFTPAAPAEDAAAEDFGPAESSASAAGGSKPASKAGTPKAAAEEFAASGAPAGAAEPPAADGSGSLEVGAVEAAWGGQQQLEEGGDEPNSSALAYEHHQQYGVQYASPEGVHYAEQYQQVDALYTAGGEAGGELQVRRRALWGACCTAWGGGPGLLAAEKLLRFHSGPQTLQQYYAEQYRAVLQDAEGGSAMEVRLPCGCCAGQRGDRAAVPHNPLPP